MILVGSLAYAQGRMQARLGKRPSERLWLALAQARSLRRFVDLGRESLYGDTLAHLAPRADAHGIEHGLRAAWRHEVGAVSAWMPEPWRPALRFVGSLADLPVLAQAAAGAPLPAWTFDDPQLAPLARAPAGREAEDIWSATAYAPLAPAARLPSALLLTWRKEWQQLLPPTHRQSDAVVALAELVDDAQRRFADLPPHEAWDHRRALEALLVGRFRRAILEPVAAFAYLVIFALGLERLRAELVRLALFASAGETR